MIIDCAHYQDGRRQEEGPVPLEEAAARCSRGGFVWLGLFEPGEAESKRPSGCTSWRLRTRRTFTCVRRSSSTTATCSW